MRYQIFCTPPQETEQYRGLTDAIDSANALIAEGFAYRVVVYDNILDENVYTVGEETM